MKTRIISAMCFLLMAPFFSLNAEHSVARKWNEALLIGIENDFARPTVHARNLFHTSVLMYDAWAAYDDVARTFFLGNTVGGFNCAFNGVPQPSDVQAAREEAISYAMYRIMRHRFANAPKKGLIFENISNLMVELGYDTTYTDTSYTTGNPAALGNYLAAKMIEFGLQDGSNEANTYANQFYEPVNPPLLPDLDGNPDIVDMNRWQPLSLVNYVDQSGNPITGDTIPFLSPEWGSVVPFSLTEEDLTIHERDGHQWYVYHDPGPPPLIDQTGADPSDDYKWTFCLVSTWSSHLDPTDGVMWDISPASIGNIPWYPDSFSEHEDFYDIVNGGDPSEGYDVNPKTGQPYAPQIVPRGDYTRVLAEFWADGPNSETPPGHWFTILNYVNDQPGLVKKFRGQGDVLDDLEWDVKAYFTLGGAMHDAAVTVWGIKGYYDYIRPVSALRAMADLGQSSDPQEISFDPVGITLMDDLIDVVKVGDPLAGFGNQHVGKIKVKSWKGPDWINNPETDVAGVDWILAENWWPYQRPSFVTPPFAGYVSGHSTFSRTAAEVLEAFTGDPFFPGGMGVFEAPQNEFLVFEDGPSVDVQLQWAKYIDASDQCSLSRIWGGIHPPADDIPGRKIGMVLGPQVVDFAEQYFFGPTATEDEIVDRWNNKANLFPNPVSSNGSVRFQILDEQIGDYTVELYTLTGSLVRSVNGNAAQNNTVEIGLDNLVSGMYVVNLRAGEKSAVRSLVIQ